MYDALQAALAAPLTASQLSQLAGQVKPREATKGEVLQAPAQVCRDIYFVESGLLRQFLLKDGQEMNVAFGLPGDFITEYHSLTTQQPARHFIQVLEPGRLLVLPRSGLLGLYEAEPAFQALGRALLEKLAATQELRIEALACLTAVERYACLLRQRPELLQRVPLQQLASYLGVARETLSRVRRQVSQPKAR